MTILPRTDVHQHLWPLPSTLGAWGTLNLEGAKADDVDPVHGERAAARGGPAVPTRLLG